MAERLTSPLVGLLMLLVVDCARAEEKAKRTKPKASVVHFDLEGGWSLVRSANFDICHRLEREDGARVCQVAEQVRSREQRKWLGRTAAWSERCDIYLYPSAADYGRATGAPTSSPGHSTFKFDGGRLISRRLDIRCDADGWLNSVLPHEVVHAVLAGSFDRPIPRWADEGMAMLAEPDARIETQLRELARCRRNGKLFSVPALLSMEEYPRDGTTAFYAQSVSVMRFLARMKDPHTAFQFVRDGASDDYDSSSRKHFGCSLAELERRWQKDAFAVAVAKVGR